MNTNAFVNRELSWLEFNRRVLEEAQDASVPLLERVKFLAIFSSNLDEFFMVRVAALKRRLAAGDRTPGLDGLAPVWALPLIVGSAAEYGVNIVLRALESRTHGGPRLARSTDMGVVFNALTTIAGFGTLLIADHRGVWSLGLLLAIGTTMTLAASLVVLPTLMHLVGERRRVPATEQERPLWAVGSAAG